jgi:MacB-like periplasmic core domain
VLGGEGYSVHYDQLQFLLRNNHSFIQGAAFSDENVNVYSATGEPQVIHSGIVSSNYFQILGVHKGSGVASVTLTTHLPMGDNGSNNTRNFSIPGYVPAEGEDMEVVTDFDGPDFFRTMGITIRQGRDFTDADNSTSPKVTIINESMARRYWPKGDALGSRILVDGIERQIVGIVPNFAYRRPNDTDPSPVVFLPYLQGQLVTGTPF